MAGGSTAVAFGALVAGAVVIDYGIKSGRTAFAGGSSGGTTAATPGSAAYGATSNSLAGATPLAATKVKAMQAMADALVGKPYVLGGGHSGWAEAAGYDCSGFVSAVIHAAGYLSSPQSTQSLPSAAGIASGAGKYVTIYDKTDGGTPETDHVIIDLAGEWFESGGGAGSNNPTGGVSRIPTPSASYLSEFNQLLHPVGL